MPRPDEIYGLRDIADDFEDIPNEPDYGNLSELCFRSHRQLRSDGVLEASVASRFGVQFWAVVWQLEQFHLLLVLELDAPECAVAGRQTALPRMPTEVAASCSGVFLAPCLSDSSDYREPRGRATTDLVGFEAHRDAMQQKRGRMGIGLPSAPQISLTPDGLPRQIKILERSSTKPPLSVTAGCKLTRPAD